MIESPDDGRRVQNFDTQSNALIGTLLSELVKLRDEPSIDFRANPPYGYWYWVRKSIGFGPLAFWIGWHRYQSMLNDLESWRLRNYSSLIGPYWLKP